MLIFSNKSKLSHLVFLFSITVTIFAIIPALFPALYASTNQQSLISQFITENAINPFELGMFFIPIIATLIATIIFFVVIKLKSIKFPSIDLPKKYSIIAMVIILSVFTILSYDDVISEDQHKDWLLVKAAVEDWPPEEVGFNLHVRFFMLSSSLLVFGNYRVIPFLASVALLVTTYLFANKITNNRFAGVIAAAIVLQSNLFLSYSSTPSYTVFWVLFYLISLYITVHKTWFLSPVAFITSIFSKPLTLTFFPISIFFVLDAEISVKKKIILVLAMLTIIIVGVTTLDTHTTGNGWDWDGFRNGFVSLAYQLRFDGFVVVFLIPTIIGLYAISKNNRYANSVSIMISGVIISNPLLLAMTEITSQPYRFIPLLIFLAIGVGMILTRKKEPEDTQKIKRLSKKSK